MRGYGGDLIGVIIEIYYITLNNKDFRRSSFRITLFLWILFLLFIQFITATKIGITVEESIILILLMAFLLRLERVFESTILYIPYFIFTWLVATEALKLFSRNEISIIGLLF